MHTKLIVTIPEDVFGRISDLCTNCADPIAGVLKGKRADPALLEPCQIWSIERCLPAKTTDEQTLNLIPDQSAYTIFPQDEIVGYWFRSRDRAENPNRVIQEFTEFLLDNHMELLLGREDPHESLSNGRLVPPVIGIVSGEDDPQVKLWWPCWEADGTAICFEEILPEVIHYKTDIFSRIQGVVDTDYLTDKTVVVVGLGSGGSLGARELVKSGVGNFRLVDFDRLETHNITRHACSFEDIGRFKTFAVKDLLIRNNPHVHVDTFEINILEEPETFRDIVKGSDLIFAATDGEISRLFINQVSLEERVPAVYGGVYERGFGGEVIRVIPGETACYGCVPPDVTPVPEKIIDYSAITDPTQLKAEPGLGLDVGFVVLLQAKYALLTLLRGTDSELEDIPYHMCLWGNREEWIFSEPFQCVFVKIEKREDCESCNTDAYFERKLGLSREEQELLAKKIVEESLHTKNTRQQTQG